MSCKKEFLREDRNVNIKEFDNIRIYEELFVK